MLAQVMPFSIEGIIPLIIHILFNTLTAWLSVQFVSGSARIQEAFLFALVAYVVTLFLGFIPIPSIPFLNIIILVEVVIKSLLAMKLFSTDFRGGVCVAGVQTLLGFIIMIPF